MYNTNYLIFSLLTYILLTTSCAKENLDPIPNDLEVSISNTLQTAADPSVGGTGGIETPIEAIFGLPEGALIETTNVNEGIEFVAFLDGLYDIDLSNDEIKYELVASIDHPIYSSFFRTIEANTFDRYYFKFNADHNIKSYSIENTSVSMEIISSREISITIGEGFNFNPGSGFSISLKSN